MNTAPCMSVTPTLQKLQYHVNIVRVAITGEVVQSSTPHSHKLPLTIPCWHL